MVIFLGMWGNDVSQKVHSFRHLIPLHILGEGDQEEVEEEVRERDDLGGV